MVNGVFSIPLDAYGPASRVAKKNARSKAGSKAASRDSKIESEIGLALHDGRPSSEYIGDEENTLAQVAAESVFDEQPEYNPIVFYGAAGIGKTLLARGLSDRWKQQNPDANLVVVTGADFARDYANAIDTDSLDDLRAEYRAADLLVIDDVDQLVDKPNAQKELRLTLDSLLEEADDSARVLVTMKQPPSEASELTPGLASRLSAGLTVPLKAPGPAARWSILRMLANRYEVEMANEVIYLIANGPANSHSWPTTFSELNNAVLQLDAAAKEQGVIIDESFARRCLLGQSDSQKPELKSIIKHVCKHFNVKVGELKGPTRQRRVVRARGVAMFLARQLTDDSLEQIGRQFGSRDHTTVLHACRKTESLLETDEDIQQAVDELSKQLT